MRVSWLGLLVLASLSLLLAVRAEEAPPVPGAPEVVTALPKHLPPAASAISKAWWKKFILESRGQKNLWKTPKPGVFGPLSGEDPK